MKDAQKPDHVSLTTLVGRLKEGRFVIPDFQREFEWKPWDIAELMRSIFLDYYIGSLLLWREERDLRCARLRAGVWILRRRVEPGAHRARRPAATDRHVLHVHGAGQACAQPSQSLPVLHPC
jgi:hypothetical protein